MAYYRTLHKKELKRKVIAARFKLKNKLKNSIAKIQIIQRARCPCEGRTYVLPELFFENSSTSLRSRVQYSKLRNHFKIDVIT